MCLNKGLSWWVHKHPAMSWQAPITAGGNIA